ncbi:MAG: hypothetical protein KUG73_17010 [Pseudomonadales bacterium]|nr:hypothetical protein [Pseudomonadales bacterium]
MQSTILSTLIIFLTCALPSIVVYAETIEDALGEKKTTEMKNGLIKISRIRLEGDALYPEYGITNEFINTRINQLFSHLDDKLDMAAIDKIADAITLTYREKGLTFNRAFVVPQEIENSTLTIYVLKGVLSEIDVYENSLYSSKQIKEPFDKLIGKVIYEPDVMRVVDNINKKPGLKIFAYFSTGSKQGESRLNIKVKKEIPAKNTLSIDNKGTKDTGHNRVIYSHIENNLFSLSGQFNVSFLKTNKEDNLFGGIYYQRPISENKNMGVSLVKSDFSITGQFSNLGLEGALTSASGIIANEDKGKGNISLKKIHHLVLSYKESKVTSKVFPEIFNESTRYAMFNTYHQHHYMTNVNSQHIFSITPSVGLIDTSDASSISESFFSVGAGYHYLLFNPIKLTDRNNVLSIKLSGKWSNDQLPAPERYTTTGPTVNRGYQPGIFSGDTGYRMSTEHSINWNIDKESWMKDVKIQTSLFIDYSYGMINTKERHEASFSSTGIAINATFRNLISLGASIGKPLNHNVTGDVDIDSDSPVIYANTSVTF